ncbi:FAD dependent oxidoreductase [[Clostridium] ultunense Esp]|nr:FAD dependent oxidoreductase [[Clostridium] ultunense Esp]
MENRILSDISKKLGIKDLNIHIKIDEDNIAYLEGEVNNWDEVVSIGLLVGRKCKIKNVVNNLRYKGMEAQNRDRSPLIAEGKGIGVIEEADIVIVGGGVIGCGIARELAKYDLKTCLVEKEEDVAEGASKANNGMIHPGNATIPFTLKAKLNVKGNAMYSNWAEELNFPFKRTGSLILAYNKHERRILNLAFIAGKLNRVPNMKRISGKEAMKLEPSIEKEPIVVLWSPTTAYVDGYSVTIALAENAASNGVKFYLGTQVVDVLVEDDKIQGVVTNRGIIKSRYVINVAGVYADEIAEMAGDKFYTIHPRKGGIIIFDKNKLGISRSVGVVRVEGRNKQSKGGGPQSTIEGNALWGPSAREVMDKEDLSFTREDLDYCLSSGNRVNSNFKEKDIITYFSGIRAANYKEDFVIEKSKKVRGFVHVAGIQSPGLASAPAIAEMVVNIIKDEEESLKGQFNLKENYNPFRKPPIEFRNLSREAQDKIIKKDPRFGNVICRCETITEGEIVNAIHGPIPCTTVDGVKRRTRASMGRCQGGFCGPKILSILARELNKDVTEITQKGHKSFVITKKAREMDLGGESHASNL